MSRNPIYKNTMRGRMLSALRQYGIIPILVMVFVSLLVGQYQYGWVVVLLAAAVNIGAVWLASSRTALNTVVDLENLINAVHSFNSGIHSIRTRGTSSREVRQLSDGFNKMASTAERAITSLNSEEQRQMQFVSDVSHELRTPLTAIRGAAETLIDGGVSEEDQLRFLSTIANESVRLTGLAEDLLTLRRIEGATGELPLRTFNLSEAVGRAEQLLTPLFESYRVSFGMTGYAPDILGDIDRIQQVISNLVDNAIRSVGEGGRVWVEFSSAYRSELGSQVPAKSFIGVDRFAIMAICDNGPGIPEENLEKIFDRFYRTDASRARNFGGTGLGLSIVKAIVEAHGGTIEVQNRIGGGAQFTVYLPVPPNFDL